MPKDVFISYSTNDRPLADRVCELLEQAGIACWIAPRDVAPGAVFDEALLDAIDTTQATVLLLSAHSNASPFVKNEVNRAFARGKTIFTLRVQDVLPGKSLEFYLARHQWTDGFPPPVEDKVRRLAAAILALLGRTAPAEPTRAPREVPTVSAPVPVTVPPAPSVVPPSSPKVVPAVAGPPGEIRRFKGHVGNVNCVAVSRDGRHVLSGDGMVPKAGTARLWDVETGQVVHRLEGHERWVECVAFAADDRLAVTGSQDQTVRTWDLSTGKELRRFTGKWAHVHAFSPDGRRVFTTAEKDYAVWVWDLEAEKELCRVEANADYVCCVAVSRDGRLCLSGGLDQSLCLWEIDSGRQLCNLDGHAGAVLAADISPDGRRAVSGGKDKTVRLWDLETARELRRFTGHITPVQCVAFSPDGRYILSGSGEYKTHDTLIDCTVRLWEADTGREVHHFEGHSHYVQDVAFFADGRRAVSASWDKTVRLWRVG